MSNSDARRGHFGQLMYGSQRTVRRTAPPRGYARGVKPFLLISSRPEDSLADAEYDQFRRWGGLARGDLIQHRLESEPLPRIHLDDYSGIMVGGSPFTGSIPEAHKSLTQVRVEKEIDELLDLIVAEDFPFLGACYGVGTLGRHQGGVIDFEYGEPVGPVLIEVTEAGAADPLLEGIGRTFEAYVGHKEACSTLPPSGILLATSPHCPVQMFRVKENLYGTQFHPELDYEGIAERIDLYRHVGYFPEDEVEEVTRRCFGADVTDSHLVISNFVEQYAD